MEREMETYHNRRALSTHKSWKVCHADRKYRSTIAGLKPEEVLLLGRCISRTPGSQKGRFYRLRCQTTTPGKKPKTNTSYTQTAKNSLLCDRKVWQTKKEWVSDGNSEQESDFDSAEEAAALHLSKRTPVRNDVRTGARKGLHPG